MSAYRKMLSRTQSVIIFATLTVVGCSESNEAMPRSQVTGVEAADLPNTAPAEIATPPGIGVNRDKVVRLFKDRFNVDFEDASNLTPAEHLYQATIGGVPVKLWGPPTDLEAITIFGAFEGEVANQTVVVLSEMLNIVTPNWPPEQRANWFIKAAETDTSMNVSTLQGDINVTMVSSDMGEYIMRIISFKRYGQ